MTDQFLAPIEDTDLDDAPIDELVDEEDISSDEIDEADDQELADGARGGAARPRKQITKQSAAKAIAKYIELTAADKTHLELLAVAIGGKAEPAELAATIVSSARVNLGPLNDIVTLSDAAANSPYEAMLAVFKLDRDQIKQIWSLLSAAGIASGTLTVKEQAAAVAVAEAAGKISTDDRALFDAVRSLARK